MGRAIAAIVAALACSAASAGAMAEPPRRVSTVEPGVFTWLGTHALRVAYNVPSAAACRDRCLADALCKAWQWGTAKNPDTQMRHACVLGGGHESRERRRDARAEWHVSGVVTLSTARPRRQSAIAQGAVFDVGGKDHRLAASAARPSAASCRDWCLAVARCTAWHFRAGGGGRAPHCALGTGHVDRGRVPAAKRHTVASGVVSETAASR